MTDHRLTLRVEEAFTKDQGRALARICYSFLKDCGIKVGDVIELQSCRGGAKKVGVVVIPSAKHDRGASIVRLDRYTRINLQVKLGELVTIQPVNLSIADDFSFQVLVFITQLLDMSKINSEKIMINGRIIMAFSLEIDATSFIV